MMAEPNSDPFLPTRQSLLARLRDVQDQAGWSEFFDRYWRLVYNVARRAGLPDAEAQDVVQNTFIYLSRKLPGFRYDPTRGSFKSWLRVVTRSRIGAFRRSERSGRMLIREPGGVGGADGGGMGGGAGGDADGAFWDTVEAIPDPAGDVLDEIWQREWEENLLRAALRRVRSKVSSRQLLIFRLATLSELSLSQVSRKLGVSLPQVYLARHRVGRLFRSEVEQLRREMEQS